MINLYDYTQGTIKINFTTFLFRTGELMNRLSSDSQVIQNAVTVCVFSKFLRQRNLD